MARVGYLMLLGLLYYRHKVKQHRRQAKREVRQYLDAHDCCDCCEWEVWYEVCDHDPHDYCELCT